jgi:hypothetical protein
MGVGVQGKPKKGFRIGESSIGGIGPDRVSPFFYLVFFFFAEISSVKKINTT